MADERIPLERKITDEIMSWLRSSGYWACKIHGAAYQTSGLPDIIMIDRNGRFVGLEVKRPVIGKVTLLQRKTIDLINDAGGYAVVVRSVEDVRSALLDSEGRSAPWK